MATVYYPIEVWNDDGTRGVGKPPTVLFVKKLSDLSDLTAGGATPVVVSEIGDGQYMAAYDPAAHGEATCQIDFGSSLTDNRERYKNVFLTQDSSLLATNLNAQVATAVANTAALGLTQSFGRTAQVTTTGFAPTNASFNIIPQVGDPAGALPATVNVTNPPVRVSNLNKPLSRATLSSWTSNGDGSVRVTLAAPGFPAPPANDDLINFL